MGLERSAAQRSSSGEFVRRLGHTSGIFGTGLAITAIAGIVTIAALTRVLTPAEYGQLGVLFVFSGLLALAMVYIVLPGTMSWTLGASDEDDQGVATAERTTAEDPKVALFTGVSMMLGLMVVALVLVVALREPLSGLLVHGEGRQTGVSLVLLAAANAMPTALIRLLSNILRYAGRPAQYIMVEVVRPVAVMVLAIGLVIGGHGDLHMVILLYVLSGILGLLLAAVFLRNDLALRASLHDARMILRRGRAIALVGMSNWIVLNTDTLFLSQFAAPSTVGDYRVATGLARIGSYVASTFIRAWGPMTQSPLAAALNAELTPRRVNAATLKYFVLLSCWTLVSLTVFSQVLVRIAPSDYRDAAPLIPALAGVYMLRVAFILSYHGSQRPSRRRWMFALFGVALVVFVTSSLLLIPVVGSWGAALAGDLAFAIPLAIMLTIALREPEPMPISFVHLGGAIASAAAIVALAITLGGPSLGARVLAGTVTTAGYPVLLVALGIIPRGLVWPLAKGLIAVSPLRRRVPKRQRLRLLAFSPYDLDLLDSLVRQREDIAVVARRLGMSEDVTRMHLVVLLRRLSDLPHGHGLTAAMARYVLEDEAVVHHLALSKRLVEQGCDPRSLDAVYEAARMVRAVPRRRWPGAAQR